MPQSLCRSAVVALIACLGTGLAAEASAATKLYKYDQYPDGIDSAATAIGSALARTVSGYAQGEAFGVIYAPSVSDYPITIESLDLVVPGVCVEGNINPYKTPATIEMWFGDAPGPAPPKTEPDWSIDTTDLLVDAGAGSTAGTYLTPNTALHITFDPDDPGGHPPQVFSGRIWVALRFPLEAKDYSTEWEACQAPGSTISGSCKAPLNACGCQPVGTLHDGAITPQVNILNHTAGGCTGGGVQWSYMETLGFKGDLVMRLGVKVPEGGCVPSCTGKACGSDGCGGVCGSCGAGDVCSQGTCIPGGSCTTACSGKACGDDGCGGVCGVCKGGESCDAGTCVPNCKGSCAGKVCGDDGCGGVCGNACDNGEFCKDGQCVAGSCTADCAGKVCGDDGCGGLCGTCQSGESCASGACEANPANCVGSCAGKVCGDDGCGGVCGNPCGSGLACEAGACVEVPVTAGTAPVIDSVSPNFATARTSTEISITGSGFREGVEARLGATRLGIVELVGETLLVALVPAGMTPGTYDLTVINKDETTTTLREAFIVAEESSGGCAGGGGAGGPWALVAALALLVLGASRRRTALR
ncbi:MAG: IPT/TIG domain-containing protein [Deltaproteobacteria bacterium]|nr:IPT/TIG domain-containing protein [Deltaproteobacteria bacterium]MCB9786282.1 IPT/TIG domain-containing protein [Deltaproteobacteria bacterium]